MNQELTNRLGDVTKALSHRYGAKDDQGKTLDCLKIAALPDGTYLGVSHALTEGVFHLRLSRSTDLLTWSYIATLDTHASQGELTAQPDGSFWLAYEHDEPNSCFVRLRHYASRALLEKGKFASETTLGRTLAPTAEGTPSIESVRANEIRLRFHYYRNGDVDRAASGILRGPGQWQTKIESELNAAVEAHGVKGNIGGRTRFTAQGKTWYLQEGQLRKNDWASWRIFLLESNTQKAVPVPIKTHGGSSSFANPGVCTLPGGRLFCSFFMPSEGNAPGEAGALLYVTRVS